MPELLEDPDGAPYPGSVQHFLGKYFPDLEDDDADVMRADLVAAIESTLAVDREHRPPAPELTDDQAQRLVNIWASGFASGAATAAIQLGADAVNGQALGTYLGGRTLEDPAMRLELEIDARHAWTTGEPRRPGWNMFAAYPTDPHNPGEHK